MIQATTLNWRKLVLILALIYLPLIDSFYPKMLLGLRWHSPMMMAEIGHWVMLIKILMIASGLYLFKMLRRRDSHLDAAVPAEQASEIDKFASIQATIFSYLTWTISVFHLMLLSIVFFMSYLLGSGLEKMHYQQTIGHQEYYVFNSDPGAMGKAYHYVSLKCPQPFNRYELIDLGKTPWVGPFSLILNGDVLKVKSLSGDHSESLVVPDTAVCPAFTSI